MTGHGSKFGRKQEEAIAALLTQRNVEDAAKSVGIAPKTFVRWMQISDFRAPYREARRAPFGRSIDPFTTASTEAVSMLRIMVRLRHTQFEYAPPTAYSITRSTPLKSKILKCASRH
jgi:hypothetical protein